MPDMTNSTISAKHTQRVRRFAIRWLVPSIALALCFACISVDVVISNWAQHLSMPGDIRRFINLCEVFAHGTGSTAIIATLLWIDQRNRPQLWGVALTTIASGVAGNISKYVIPRFRPYTLSSEFEGDGWQTWGQPFTESWFDETIRSFPSGHTATAVSLAIGLTMVYPRGRYIFASIAVLACAQRLISGAHYASDILASIALAIVITVPILSRWAVSNNSGAA